MHSVIIILGNSKSSVMDKRINRALVEYNKPLYNESDDAESDLVPRKRFILITGTPTETRYMYNYLIEKEVHNGDIAVDDKACNTVSNLINSANIITSSLAINPTRITVCTSTYHIKRSIVISRVVMGKWIPIVDYIHTNENVTETEAARENNCLSYFLDTVVARIPMD